MGELDIVVVPLPFDKLNGVIGPTRQIGELDSVVGPTLPFGELDGAFFIKTDITSATRCLLTSDRWHWKTNSTLYLVSKYEPNRTVGRSPSIARHLTRLCSPALKKLQKTPKSPKFSRTYLNL